MCIKHPDVHVAKLHSYNSQIVTCDGPIAEHWPKSIYYVHYLSAYPGAFAIAELYGWGFSHNFDLAQCSTSHSMGKYPQLSPPLFLRRWLILGSREVLIPLHFVSVGFSISSHPQDVIVVYGQEAKLEVRTDGLGQMCSYQWYKDGRKLLGKTQKSMVIASTVDSDEGSYTCLISNSEGSVMSHPATITVVSVAPQSSQQPKPTRPVVERRSHPTHLPIPPQYRNTGASYGLTGRGVDDDDCDERISEPSYTAAVPSIPSSTAPPKGMCVPIASFSSPIHM